MISKHLRHTNVLAQLTSSQQLPKRFYQKSLTMESLSDNVKNAEYAVRGKIPLRGEEI